MKLFGVFDGHGINGHLVSEMISKNIKGFLSKSL